MIVKMLTHVHMLVHTLWCWHTLRRRLRLEGLREDWVSAHFVVSALFEKMKCIFSIAPVENLEKSQECFLLRNTYRTQHRTLSLSVRCAVVLDSTRVKHRTMHTGCRVTPVHASGAI